MKEITIEEAKQIELDLLLNFAEFCNKHNLTYYLAYGTLLGAVRHKGFIPWDDDVDVFMPRKDYNQLRKLFNKEMMGTNYFAVDPESDIAKHTIVKITDTRTIKLENGLDYKKGYLGVDIDVFPLDGMPEDEEEFNKWYKSLFKLYRRHLYKKVVLDGNFKNKVKIFVQKILYGSYLSSCKGILKKTAKIHSLYPFDKCEYVGCMESHCNLEGNRVRKEVFSDIVLLDFEGYKLNAPIGYDEFLTSMYGDYMKLPPKEMQETHHGNNMFWKEN